MLRSVFDRSFLFCVMSGVVKVAMQGYEGCFHQLAARRFFGEDVEAMACATFGDVTRCVGQGSVDAGIMAIENSIAGSIMPNYGLLEGGAYRITGEVLLHIRQHLMALPGVRLDEIEEVHSHPMALLQCVDFLEGQGRRLRLVETEDTALSARRVSLAGERHVAAIAGSLAAELFGLDIVAADIHTVKDNYTRFLVICRADKAERVDGADKASLYFKVPHRQGSLVAVLRCFDEQGLNMSKLLSCPIPADPFTYLFHADVEFGDEADFDKAVVAARRLTDELCVCGVYKKGRFVE